MYLYHDFYARDEQSLIGVQNKNQDAQTQLFN